MMFPLINYSTTYELNKKPYEIFQFVERQNLVKSASPFQQNEFNLVMNLLHTDPLIMQFYLDKGFRPYRMPHGYAASMLRATFIPAANGSVVKVNIRSNWNPVLLYCLLTLGLIFALIQGINIIPYLLGITIFVWLDISGKMRVKNNFEKLIHAADNH